MNDRDFDEKAAKALEYEAGSASEAVWAKISLKRRSPALSLGEMLSAAAASAVLLVLWFGLSGASFNGGTSPNPGSFEQLAVVSQNRDEAKVTVAMLQGVGGSP